MSEGAPVPSPVVEASGRRSLEAPDWVYLGLCVAVLLAVARYVAELNWGGDYWEHAAAAAELARHPLSPANPYSGTPGNSVLLDTWHLLVGMRRDVEALIEGRQCRPVTVDGSGDCEHGGVAANEVLSRAEHGQ